MIQGQRLPSGLPTRRARDGSAGGRSGKILRRLSPQIITSYRLFSHQGRKKGARRVHGGSDQLTSARVGSDMGWAKLQTHKLTNSREASITKLQSGPSGRLLRLFTPFYASLRGGRSEPKKRTVRIGPHWSAFARTFTERGREQTWISGLQIGPKNANIGRHHYYGLPQSCPARFQSDLVTPYS
jgi:hypothetical protein